MSKYREVITEFKDGSYLVEELYLALTLDAALFITRVMWWSSRMMSISDGWFTRTATEWKADTGFNEKRQRRARNLLKEYGLLDERETWRNVAGILKKKIWYKANFEAIRAFCRKQQKAENRSNASPVTAKSTDRAYQPKSTDRPISPNRPINTKGKGNLKEKIADFVGAAKKTAASSQFENSEETAKEKRAEAEISGSPEKNKNISRGALPTNWKLEVIWPAYAKFCRENRHSVHALTTDEETATVTCFDEADRIAQAEHDIIPAELDQSGRVLKVIDIAIYGFTHQMFPLSNEWRDFCAIETFREAYELGKFRNGG